ncbi:MAG: glycosyltransferase family 39 protein [bacterium]|nr:glycosyltransferase family 39 protein [bacterium]
MLRIGYSIEYIQSPFFHSPSIDGIYHIEWAKKIVETGEWNFESNKPFFRTPFYPTFLALCFSAGLTKEGIVIVQSLLGLLSLFLVFRIADALFHRKIAIIAATIFALGTPFLSYEMEFQLPALMVPIGLTVFYNFILFYKQKSLRNGLLTSFFIGLFTITQPNGFILIFPLFYLIKKFKVYFKLKQKLLLSTLWILPVLPVTVYNYLQSGEFVFLSTQGGVNAYLGNNPQADGAYAIHPMLGEDWEWEEAKRWVGENLTDAQADQMYYLKVFAFWYHNPFEAILLFLRKILYCIHWYDIGNNRNLQLFWNEFVVTKYFFAKFYFGVILPFALFGFFLLWKNKEVRFLIGIVSLFMFSYVPFFITTRYRLPFLSVMPILVAYTINTLIEKKIELTNLKQMGLFLFCIALVWHPLGAPKADAAQFYYSKGNAYQNLKDPINAIQFYYKAIQISPNKPMYLNNMGTAYLQLDEIDSAKFWIEKAYQLTVGKNKNIVNNLGVIQERLGYYFSAMNSYQAADQLKDKNAAINLKNLFYRVIYSPPSEKIEIKHLKGFSDSLTRFNPNLAERLLLQAKLAILDSDLLQFEHTLKEYQELRNEDKLYYYDSTMFQQIIDELIKIKQPENE